MRNWFARAKARVLSAWSRFRAWLSAAVLAVLAALGVLVYAAPVGVSWHHPTLRTDGTALPLDEIAETRWYCDGDLVDSFPVAVSSADQAESVDLNLSIGTHECYATTVDTVGQESDPSVTIERTVNPARPNPPDVDP